MTEQWLGNPARKPWETVTVQSVAPIKAEVARVAAAISADAHDDPAEFVRQARHAAMLLPASLRESCSTISPFLATGVCCSPG